MSPKLNKTLFGDVDYESLDCEKHARFIIGGVLMRGNWNDWQELKQFYGLEKIRAEAVQIRYLDKKTLNFCACLFNLKEEDFKCYNVEPSLRQLWNY